MGHWWWKILGAALLLFVVIVGLRTPLSPALIACSPDRIELGDQIVQVHGYGTRFKEGVLGAWIENDGQRVCAASMRVDADNAMALFFNVPRGLRNEMSDLVVRTSTQGDLRYPAAFYTVERGTGVNAVIADGCRPPDAPPVPRTFTFPDRNILNETIRNLFFHVPMWFTMVTLMGIGVWMSVLVLRNGSLQYDRAALAAVQTGLVFGCFGLITGSMWARVTWETWWTTDVKLNGAAVGVLVYLAYLVLRGSVNEPAKRARLSAIYSIFAFAFMVLFFFILPRLNAVDSLHPGNGGNPAFNTYDLDNRLRIVFYPACIGWISMGLWMYQLRRRTFDLQHHLADATPQ